MAHNLNIIDGKASLFTTKPAWHGLGTVVKEAQTSDNAIKLAKLDFEVSKRELYVNVSGDESLRYNTIDNKYATVRLDTGSILGIVGSRYTILPNEKAFQFIDEIVGSKEAIFETAGALGKGERIFLTCKLPNRMVIGKDDVADNYLFLTNSHDGTSSVEMMFTNVFVVCENTVRMAQKSGKYKKKIRHTSTVYTNLHNAAEVMGITKKVIDDTAELYNALTDVKVSDKQLAKYIRTVIAGDEKDLSTRTTNTINSILEYGLGDPAQQIEERKGTLWGAYNAITGYYNNIYNYKDAEDKTHSLLYGNGESKNQVALSLAVDYMLDTSILDI